MCRFFVKINGFEKILFQEYHNSIMDPHQGRHFVGPDLGPACLQCLSADDKSLFTMVISRGKHLFTMAISRVQKFVYNGYQQMTKVCLQWLSADDKSLFAMAISRGQKFVYNDYQQRTKVCLQWLSADDKSLFTMAISR